MSPKYQERLESLQALLGEEAIDLGELRSWCVNGIPDTGNVRPLCWRLLLDYLPLNRNEWPAFLTKQRSVYQSFVHELIVKPGLENAVETASPSDHPLNPNPTSAWSTYFRDNEVLLQIDKDVRRLCPEMSFFQQPCHAPLEPPPGVEPLSRRIATFMLESQVLQQDRSGTANLVSNSGRKMAAEEYQFLADGQEAHWEVVERILFVFSKLNPGVKYIQGMNEIIGPIYYVLATDSDQKWARNAEADSYYCFQSVMSEVKDCFIKTLDSSSCGIESTMTKLYEKLAGFEPELHRYLSEDLKLLPQYYAFRWLSLLLSQEFLLPDVIRIWDSLFASNNYFDFLVYICLALIINVKDEIMKNDFSANMKMLQNYPPCDIPRVIAMATRLQKDAYEGAAAGDAVPVSPTERLQDRVTSVFSRLTTRNNAK